jgi:hypothetical protein
MTKPIPDKAEVVVEYPDKFYIGTFERTARFDAHLDETGISLSLHRSGDAETKKSIRMHLHYALFAEILRDLAKTVSSMPPADVAHRELLRDAAQALYSSLSATQQNEDPMSKGDEGQSSRQSCEDDFSKMTPEQEVLLLHVME